MNLHIKNSSPDSILSTDLYMNVYTQDAGTTNQYMQIALFPVLDISIPQSTDEILFTEIANKPNATKTWKIWNLYTHTHKYGSSYNAFVRNPDGSKGEMIYNGDYSYELGFDVGYYRTGPEVTFRYFPDNELFEIDPRIGIVHEAGFTNTEGPDPVLWGLTSADEMMVLGVQYVEGSALTGVNEIAALEGLRLFPNPTNGQFSLTFNLLEKADLQISVRDLLGRQVINLYNGNSGAGIFDRTFESEQVGMTAGIYLLDINVNGNSVNKKLVISE